MRAAEADVGSMLGGVVIREKGGPEPIRLISSMSRPRCHFLPQTSHRFSSVKVTVRVHADPAGQVLETGRI